MDNTMASDKMVPITAQQPSEDDQLKPFTMNDSKIMDLISATHIIVPADEKFDADSLFVVVKNILRRSTHIVDNVFLGQEHLENLEEEVSRISFNPLLRTLKQLIYEMACKAPGVEVAHKTMMLILNKLSSYSWDAKAVLVLATFALDYEEYFLALAQPHSSHQLIESMEIPKHVPANLKHSDIQRYGKTICELNKIINNTLDVMESIFEMKKLYNNGIEDEHLSMHELHAVDPVNIYWIIITVIACTSQMYCLKSDEDKTQELLPFSQKISHTHFMLRSKISIRHHEIERLKPIRRKMKELLQTPDEIIEVFKALIFAEDDDMQPLIDGSTSKMISIDVLKKKKVLLLISGLDISRDDISILKSTYDEIREKGYDEYKIVWIPIVEQWTDGLQKKFEMLRSKMPWYIVQYFSPLAGIKFIKEAWHFENRPIVVVMNSQGDVFNENALNMIRDRGMDAFPFCEEQVIQSGIILRLRNHSIMLPPRGPYAIEEYTFFCGGKDKRWIEQFSEKVNVLAEDLITKEAYIFIELSCVGKSSKQQHFWKHYQKKKTESNPWNQEIQKLLLSFKNESRWAVLTKWLTRVVSVHGTTILKVLEAFEEWKVNVPEKGFEICFKEYHDKFLKTGPQPSTS